MADGQKITFTSEGDQEPGLEPGDIIIVLDEKAHDTFKRSGQDLIMKMDITLTEALTGMKKTIKSLDERTLVIQTVRGESTISNKLQTNLTKKKFLCRRSHQNRGREAGSGRRNALLQKPVREGETLDTVQRCLPAQHRAIHG